MGLFDFVKDAGEKLFGRGKAKEVEAAEAAANEAAANAAKAEALSSQVKAIGLKVDNLKVEFDDGLATVHGETPSLEEREKVVLVVGNTQGVARVDDRMTIADREPEAVFYTVKSGDSLSKISKAHYGDPMKYEIIFEANKPMLKHPDKIYPGQVLRIPQLG